MQCGVLVVSYPSSRMCISVFVCYHYSSNTGYELAQQLQCYKGIINYQTFWLGAGLIHNIIKASVGGNVPLTTVAKFRLEYVS